MEKCSGKGYFFCYCNLSLGLLYFFVDIIVDIVIDGVFRCYY